MTDTVERLLAKPPSLGFEDHDPTFDDRMDAAKEIKRLRKLLSDNLMEGSARNVTLEEAAKVAHRISAYARSYGGEETAEMIEREIRALKDGAKT